MPYALCAPAQRINNKILGGMGTLFQKIKIKIFSIFFSYVIQVYFEKHNGTVYKMYILQLLSFFLPGACT